MTADTAERPVAGSLGSSPPRCTQCNARPKENARNLIVCIDGTSNEFGQNNTNVVKLFAKIDQETTDPKQLAYYSSGIGTGPKSSNVLNRVGKAVLNKVDMAVAWNKGETVKETYGWLAKTYQEGDQIYLFGFSRGAYQVRILAAMIHEVGLIREPTEKQIGTAYDSYEVIYSGNPERKEIARNFKNTFSWKGLRVHFVGVWDTVSSVGIIRGNVFLSASSSAAHACHFRHALALDELRVKFMPEYIYEVNTQTDDRKSKSIATSPDVEWMSSPTIERHGSTSSDKSDKNKTTDIKEVWFAGSHSDVGGTDRPGNYHSGNVSLLWMRREATANGLVLHPTDRVWVPDDIDLGTSDSMTSAWRVIEYVPIKHQVSFSGAGDDARRVHRFQPRRIIPGQKIHASILYGNTYRPQASLGEGFYIPVVHGELDGGLDNGLWETGLFEDTSAQKLMAHLGDSKEVEPIYLDTLLFMLGTKEGRQCVRNVPNWQSQLVNLIHSSDRPPIVGLVATIAYYETASDTGDPSQVELSQDILHNARNIFHTILAARKHQDDPRLIALIRPLTKHQILREHILTQDILEMIVKLLDVIISQTGGIFGSAMDGLDCLLQCEDTRGFIIEKLGANFPYSKLSRLSRILDVNGEMHNSRLLASALCMATTLARIPRARSLCLTVKPRIRELARKEEPIVGPPAVQIWLCLSDPNDQEQLNIRDAQVRSNLAGALVRLDTEKRDSTDGQGHDLDTGQLVLRQIFGLDATELNEAQKKLIGELKTAAQRSSTRERTNATFTLLKLCKTETIRTFLCETDLLGVFINQLRRKDSALLAAYALATCLKYSDVKQSIKDNTLLLKNIVNMLRLNYFDDAIGQVEGFRIFGDLMQHANLREEIKNHNVIEVLNAKLAKCKPKETRTSLICLDIIQSFDQDGHQDSQILEKLGVHGSESIDGGRERELPTQD